MAKLRPIPAILMNAIRRQHPRLHAGYILDDEHVLLHMVDDEGKPEDRITRYVASPEFKTAVRVCDTGDADTSGRCSARQAVSA